MSRIGNKAIAMPSGVTIEVKDDVLVVKGPKGELSRPMHKDVALKIEGTEASIEKVGEDLFARALWGTYASHLSNMVTGVTDGFQKVLEVEGVGFKSEVKGKNIEMALGFSHPVIIEIPEDLTVTAEKNVITVTGIDKERVGQFAASVRSKKKPEPYKGKGIRYQGEVIRRKEGKKSV